MAKDKNKKGQTKIKKDEFRHSKKIKHPGYVFVQIGDEMQYLGVTHAKITKGIKNIPLDQNPNPKDLNKSYIVPKVESDDKEKLGKPKKGWNLSAEDKKKIKHLTHK